MKLNNFIFLSAVLAVSACSKSKDYPNIITQLEESAGPESKELQRSFANIPTNKCLKDIFSVDLVKAEIKEIEKKFKSGTKVTGKWKHLNLEDLPIPQANFLKTYGSKIGDMNDPDAFDYSSCKDVPCIFNKIYGKEDNVAGYVHYLWYLKMGNLLAATNNVYQAKSQTKPGIYNGKEFKVSSYLYRDSEIYAFWRLLMMVKEPHTKLAQFTEIHRVPQGESFDFVVEERKAGKGGLGETCGLAWSSGFVILQDLCMSVGGNWEGGSFYDSVLHEITHQLDYHEGRKLKKTYRSSEQDYLDVSKFYLKEFVDENNKPVRQWEHKEGIKLVTGYAGTSPAENFAETISWFRTEGTTTKSKISTEHWDFVKEKYFAKKAYDKSTLMPEWMTTHSSTVAQLAFRTVGECANSTQKFASTYFKAADFATPVLPAMMNCLGAKATDISLELRSKIKVSDPDGCKVLTEWESKNTWEPLFKPQLASVMSKYLQELKADKGYFAKIQTFIDGIPDNKMAKDAYLSCADLENEEACYQESVEKLALEKLAPLSLPEAHAVDLAQMYLSAHSLADIKDHLMTYYRAFVGSHRAQVDLEAQGLWESCVARPVDDVSSPTGKYFTVSSGYMVSSIYNCLNIDFPATAKLIVRNLTVGDIKVAHPKEESILYNEVIPELQKSLQLIFAKQKEIEKKEVQDFISRDQGKIRKEVLSDFSWVKDVLNTGNILKDCQKLALSKIDFPLRYELPAQAFGPLAESACRDIHLAPEYSTWLEESKSVFADKSVDGLESRIYELAVVQAKACVTKYPVDTNLNRVRFKKDRDNCLLAQWPQIEGSAIKEFESDPMVIKFKVDVGAVKEQLAVNRRRIQLKVMKENF